jgi:glycosyltransferase involved in cell wall biosynthesis
MAGKDSKLRIAVFTRPLDNWVSGSGHHLQEILNAALDLAEDRMDFTFVHYKPSSNPIYKRRIKELIVPRNPLRSAAALRREKFDVVHYAPLTIYSPIWRVPGLKLATLHGAEPLLLPQYYGKIMLAHETFVVPAYARRMDRIVTVSETSASFIAEHFRVPRERISVCYNGLGPAYRILDGADISAPGRYGVEGPFVLHVSRFSERKNPWTLLEAFSRLKANYDRPLSFVCAGGGWNDEEVLDRVRELGLAESFVAPGFVPEDDIVELMNAASVFVFPSLAEGFGMPNVEAMACGCPVVTTPAFAVREIVGDAAVVVEDPRDPVKLSEAIHRVLSDEGLRSSLVERGLARLPLFSWTDSAKKLLAVYEEMASAAS